jgi:predicted Zn-dependent peptidase
MAVIVVGDFDQEEMVQKVKQKFAEIPAPENPRTKEFFDIPPHKETLVSIATDRKLNTRWLLFFINIRWKKQKRWKITGNPFRQKPCTMP